MFLKARKIKRIQNYNTWHLPPKNIIWGCEIIKRGFVILNSASLLPWSNFSLKESNQNIWLHVLANATLAKSPYRTMKSNLVPDHVATQEAPFCVSLCGNERRKPLTFWWKHRKIGPLPCLGVFFAASCFVLFFCGQAFPDPHPEIGARCRKMKRSRCNIQKPHQTLYSCCSNAVLYTQPLYWNYVAQQVNWRKNTKTN